MIIPKSLEPQPQPRRNWSEASHRIGHLWASSDEEKGPCGVQNLLRLLWFLSLSILQPDYPKKTQGVLPATRDRPGQHSYTQEKKKWDNVGLTSVSELQWSCQAMLHWRRGSPPGLSGSGWSTERREGFRQGCLVSRCRSKREYARMYASVETGPCTGNHGSC